MDNQEYKEKIKKIIKRGYNLKLISAELKIPIEELEMYKNEIEKENQEKTTTNIITRKNTRIVRDSTPYNEHSRMLMLKDKYYKLYNKGSKNNFIAEKRKLTEQENDKLEKLFEKIKEELPYFYGWQRRKDTGRHFDQKTGSGRYPACGERGEREEYRETFRKHEICFPESRTCKV